MFGGLPQVGAQAVIANLAGFNQAANQVNRQLNIINRSAINLERSSTGAFKAFAVGIGAAAIAATTVIGGFAIKASAELEKIAATAKAVGDATAAEMDLTAKSVRSLSREYTVAQKDIATATKELVKGGLSIDTINRSALTATTLLARLADGEISVAQAADRVAQSLTAFNLGADESFRITNTLAGVTLATTANYADLNVQLKQATPIAAALGHTLEMTGAALGALNQAGLRGEVAGTAYKNMLIALIDPTTKAAEVLKDYEVSLFNADGRAKDARAIIVELNKAFGDQAVASGKLTQAEQQRALSTIFSTRQIQAALTFLNQGVETYDRTLAAIQSTASEELARKIQNNLIDQLALAKNNVTALATAVTDQLIPGLTKLAAAQVSKLQAVDVGPFERLGTAISKVIFLQDQFAAAFAGRVLASINNYTIAISTLVNAFLRLLPAIDIKAVVLGLADGFVFYTTVLRVVSERIADVIASLASTAAPFVQAAAGVLNLGTAGLQGADMWARAFAAVADMTENALMFVARVINRIGIGALAALLEGGLALQNAWGEIWLQIAQTVARALNNIATNIVKFVNSLGSLGPGVLKLLGIDEIPAVAGLRNIATEFEAFGASIAESTRESIGAAQGHIDALRQSGVRLEQQAEATGGAWRGTLKNFLGDIREIARVSKEQADAMIADFARIINGTQSMEDAHDRWRRALANNARRDAERVGSEDDTDFDFGDDGGGKIPKAEQLAAMQQLVAGLLSDMPGITKELTEFIAAISIDAPERLAPMVSAIRQSREQVIGLINAKRSVLAIDMQLAAVEERLTGLQLEANLASIEQAQALIGFDKQLLGLRQQSLEVDRATWPIRDALEKIERQMAKLQQENLVLAKRRLELELEMLPVQHQIEDINKKIADLDRVDFANAKARIQVDIASIGIRRQIEDIETRMAAVGAKNFALARQTLLIEQSMIPMTQALWELENRITDSVDKRKGLYDELKSLDLADIEGDLADAWKDFDVNKIIALETEKKRLEDSLKNDEKAERAKRRTTIGLELEKITLEEQLTPLQRRLELIGFTEDKQRVLNDLTLLGLEEQIAALELLLVPLDAKALRLDREKELRELINSLTKLGLEEERVALETILKPLQDKLDAINREVALENLRNQLAILHLEEERRKLEEQLIPYEDQRKAIERIIAEIEFQRAAASLSFEERKLQIQEMILGEQRLQAQLEITRRAQHAIYEQLILDFINTLTESKAFSAEESVEVAKRLRFWDDQVAKLAESTMEMARLTTEANKTAEAIRAIPDRTITVTTVYRTVTEGGAIPGAGTAPTGDGGGEPQFAQGGRVPGPTGKPIHAIVHGGELIIPNRSFTPSNVSASEARSVTNISNSSVYNYNLDINPRYEQYQSPARLRDDVNAILMSTQK